MNILVIEHFCPARIRVMSPVCYFLYQPHPRVHATNAVTFLWLLWLSLHFPNPQRLWASFLCTRVCVSSLVKTFLVFCLWEVVFVLLLKFASLSILDASPLSGMNFAKILSQSVAHLCSLTNIVHKAKVFILMKSNLCGFFLLWIVFLVSDLRKLCLSKVTKVFPRVLEVS